MFPKFKVKMSVMALDKKTRFEDYPFAEMEFMVRDSLIIAIDSKSPSVFKFITDQLKKLSLAVPTADELAADEYMFTSANDIIKFNHDLKETRGVVADKFNALILNGLNNTFGTILDIQHKTRFFNVDIKISVEREE
ncbi:hypothetical protein SPLA10_PHROGS00001 [Salmonella phage SPLA10]|nr:hypothetical protein SPLA10_PHROGS00001 [Salmonella phage SPLA10]